MLVSLVNLLKTTATTGAIFSLQFTKNRLATKLCLDPLGELERSPKLRSRNRGPTSKGGEGRREEGRGKEETGNRGKGKGRRKEKRGGERKEVTMNVGWLPACLLN